MQNLEEHLKSIMVFFILANSPFHGYFFSFALQCNLACM